MNLSKIRIPASVTSIDDTAFDSDLESLIIYGAHDSEAMSFAQKMGYQFVEE